jgi:hypothetical protein
MDIIFFFTGPFIAFGGASLFAALFLALFLGSLVASVFVAIFYAANRIGKAASRASGLETNS